VVPSVDNQQYTTRIVDADGNALTDLYGLDLGGGIILGSGNPADGDLSQAHPEDVSMGVSFSIKNVGPGNMYARIRVDPAD
jgi:immune inhibitor A